MSVIGSIKLWAESVVGSMGYSGIVLLTGLGCANIPIPSEAVMPFGGILAGQGKLDFNLVALAGTLGSVLGSIVSYGFGAFLGHDFLVKYGKYVLMRAEEVENAERWFNRYGLQVTLWGRFVPIVRSFVSLPAGMYRSNLAIFVLYSFIGSLPWCYLWAYLGKQVGQHWDVVENNMQIVDAVIVLAIVALIGKFVWGRFRRAAEPKS